MKSIGNKQKSHRVKNYILLERFFILFIYFLFLLNIFEYKFEHNDTTHLGVQLFSRKNVHRYIFNYFFRKFRELLINTG